jgi:hypothetical protein
VVVEPFAPSVDLKRFFKQLVPERVRPQAASVKKAQVETRATSRIQQLSEQHRT